MAAFDNEASWSFPEDLPDEFQKPEVGDEILEDAKRQKEAYEKPQESSESTAPRRRLRSLFTKTPPLRAEPPLQQPKDEPPQPSDHHTPPRPIRKRRRAHYPPRQCRICLEIVPPTFSTDEPSTFSTFTRTSEPRATYTSAEGGRLLRPCKCKGSQKYVHEDCLRSWRFQNPSQKRNYWECPTCRYRYQLQRLKWGAWIGSTLSQIALTLLVFGVAMFALGFVADPIINLYLDPVNTLASGGIGPTGSLFDDDLPPSWGEHFAKGLATLGLLGFAKLALTLGPWNWYNMRGFWLGGGRGGGRDRIQQLGLATVLIGVVTFLFAVWKGVRLVCRRVLESAGERVMDVPGVDDDDDDDTDENNNGGTDM